MVRGLAGLRGVGHAEGQILGSAAHQEEEWPGGGTVVGVAPDVQGDRALGGAGMGAEGRQRALGVDQLERGVLEGRLGIGARQEEQPRQPP